MATAKKTTPARKSAAKKAPPARRAAANVAQPVKAADKPAAKVKKPKLVRHSYTLTKPEYEALQALKERATRAGHAAKKGEIVRAGIGVLAALPDAGLLSALASVPSRKVLEPKR